MQTVNGLTTKRVTLVAGEEAVFSYPDFIRWVDVAILEQDGNAVYMKENASVAVGDLDAIKFTELVRTLSYRPFAPMQTLHFISSGVAEVQVVVRR